MTGAKQATWSTSWKVPMPLWKLGLDPPIATTGHPSAHAEAMPVSRFSVPGPEHPMHTPTSPVTLL